MAGVGRRKPSGNGSIGTGAWQAPGPPAAAASPPPAAARGNDTDLMDPNEADAPAAAAPGDDRAPIDPYGDDGAAADDPVTAAETELDAAGKDAAAKMMAEHDAEAALGKAQTDLAAAQANLRDKSDKYYAAQAKAHPAPGHRPQCRPARRHAAGLQARARQDRGPPSISYARRMAMS